MPLLKSSIGAWALIGSLAIASNCILADSGSPFQIEESHLFGDRPDAFYPIRVSNNVRVAIDGRIEEEVWANLPVHSTFYVANDRPENMVESEFSTQVRIFYNDNGLYVSFDLEQDPETYVQRLSPRDSGGLGRDWVSIGIDTSGDGHYGYFVTVCLGGTQLDGTIQPPRKFSRTWDGVWWGKAIKTSTGWSSEMYIPWNVLNMVSSPDERNIGLYLARQIAHVDQHVVWPKIHLQSPVFFEMFQPMVLQNVGSKPQLTLFPYMSSINDLISDAGEFHYGSDVYFRPSPNFQFTGTLRPDFGTVEADDVVINLSAFETFFPEKRLFFQEDMDVFKTNSDHYNILHTRRIGSPPIRPEIPQGAQFDFSQLRKASDIAVATKISFAVNQFRFGVLSAIEEDTKFHAMLNGEKLSLQSKGRDFLVLRGIYEKSGSVNRKIGFMATRMDHPLRSANAIGFDSLLKWGNGKYQWMAEVVQSDTTRNQTGIGFQSDIRYQPQGTHRYTVSMGMQNPDFDVNALGYGQRNNVRGIGANAEFQHYDYGIVKESNTVVNAIQLENFDGEKINSGLNATSFIILKDLNVLWFGIFRDFNRIDDRSSYGNGSFQKPGNYSWGMDFGTDSNKRFSTYQWMSFGRSSFGGDSVSGSFSFQMRPFDRWNIRMQSNFDYSEGFLLHSYEKNFMRYDSQQLKVDFANEFFLTSNQHLRLDLVWNAFKADANAPYVLPSNSVKLQQVAADFQLSDEDFAISRLNLQIRYRWEIAPLSDLYVVYTRGASLPDALGKSFVDAFAETFDYPVAEFVAVKLRYRFGVEQGIGNLFNRKSSRLHRREDQRLETYRNLFPVTSAHGGVRPSDASWFQSSRAFSGLH